MLLTILLIAICWGIYGIVAGLFVGSNGFLTIVGYAMILLYVIICVKALFNADWTLFVGIPCFAGGADTGYKIANKANTNTK